MNSLLKPSTFPVHRTRVLITMLAGLVLATLGISAATAQAAGETLLLEQTIVGGGAEVTTLTSPSGTTPTLVLKYRCDSTADPCQGVQLSVTIPTGLTIATVGTSVHVQSITGTGQSRTFAMNDLAPGATGAISVELNIPGNTTPDGTNWSWNANATGTNTPSVTSNLIDVTARAGSETTADANLRAGGARGGLANYAVSGCNNRKTPTTTWGPLGVLNASELSVTIPTGAVIFNAGTGVLTTVGGVRKLTWTFGSMGVSCSSPEFVLEYPASDPSNAVGASKQLDVVWTGRLVGESNDRSLGTKTLTHSLTAPMTSVSPFKRVVTPRFDGTTHKATINDTVTYEMGGDNTGTVTLDEYRVSDAFPDAVKVTSLDAFNPGRQAGQLLVATRFGADGILGTADDDQLVLNRTVAARGSETVSFASLGAQNAVTKVEMRAFEIRPSDGGTYLNVRTKVLSESRSGVETTLGASVRNDADFVWRSTINGTQSADGAGKFATFVIDMPTAGLYVRNFGTTVPSGSRVTPQLSLSAAPVVDNDLINPVFVLQLPPGFSLETWSGPTNLPAPTLQTLTNWKGTGDTLVRWTFPRGTVAQKDTAYHLPYKLRLARNIYSTKTVRGYIGSSSQPVTCYQNFFDSSADVDDRDNDGNTTEVLCPWFANIDHPTSSAAVLTTSVKGDWDSAFVDSPGTGYSKPGGDDTYRVTLESQATMGLDQASIIDVLPRPGDTGVISGAQRNPTSRTFPVLLRGRPAVPALTSTVRTYYSTVSTPCRTEYGFTAANCNPPNWTNWDVAPPSDVRDVTAVKADFGNNVLAPGDSWSIDLPVTTPTTGATEPDFAGVNPDPLQPGNDEIAKHTAAFEVRRSDINATLLPSESLSVGLRMPSMYGPAAQTITASDRTSSGVGTEPHDLQISVPLGGSVALVDGGNPVSEIVKPGVGKYTLDPQSGQLRFVPELGYVGTPAAVTYRRTNYFGAQAEATYIPTVTAPPAPQAPPRTSTGIGVTPQEVTLAIPTGGSVRLLEGGTPATEVTIPGEGRYVLDPETGKVTFAPARGFAGRASALAYRIIDAYGSQADSTYTATVVVPATPPEPTPSVVVTPAPAAAVAPAATTTAARCISLRAHTIHWWTPRGTKLARIRMLINSRPVATFRGSVRAAIVDLRGRPLETVRVEMIGTTTTGKRVGTTRTYRTCRPRLNGPPLPTLRLLPLAAPRSTR